MSFRFCPSEHVLEVAQWCPTNSVTVSDYRLSWMGSRSTRLKRCFGRRYSACSTKIVPPASLGAFPTWGPSRPRNSLRTPQRQSCGVQVATHCGGGRTNLTKTDRAAYASGAKPLNVDLTGRPSFWSWHSETELPKKRRSAGRGEMELQAFPPRLLGQTLAFVASQGDRGV